MNEIKARFYLKKADFILDVNLKIPLDGITVICGHSGAGKTLLLRCIAGLEHKIEQAELSLPGVCLHSTENNIFILPNKRNIGYISQNSDLFPHLSIQDNLLYGFKRNKSANKQIQVNHVIQCMELNSLISRKGIQNLSGGERQKISIARSLLSNPKLLLMDEPISAIDKQNRIKTLHYIHTINKEFSIPMIYITHHEDELEHIVGMFIRLKQGRII